MSECKEYKVKVYSDRTEWYNLEGELHREGAPAVEYTNGNKYWYINGKRHNENGPTVELANGYKKWYINGKLHNENGPAVECANGDKSWYLNDKYYSESDWKKEVEKLHNKTQSHAGKVVIVDGKEYILTEKH